MLRKLKARKFKESTWVQGIKQTREDCLKKKNANNKAERLNRLHQLERGTVSQEQEQRFPEKTQRCNQRIAKQYNLQGIRILTKEVMTVKIR